MPKFMEVAYKFVPAFFEEVATSPSNLAGMYGSESSLLLVDFEHGTKKAHGPEIPPALLQWVHIIQGCQLSVDDVSAFPLHSGVCVHLTLMAESPTLCHFFQITTNLEEYPSGDYSSSAFFIINQIVNRTGAMEKEQNCVARDDEAKHEAKEEEPQAEVSETPVVKEGNRRTSSKRSDAKGRASSAVVAGAPCTTVDGPSGPKTWASLAVGAAKGEHRMAVKGLSGEGAAGKIGPKPVSAHTKQPPQPENRRVVSPKRNPKHPRPSPEAVGDRLMFSVDHAVSDEEIIAALGDYSSRIVSLRNNSSSKGLVFFDFSNGEDSVFEGLRAKPFVVGADPTPLNVFRQKPRS